MTDPNAAWLAEHDQYLQSSAWAERRGLVLQRDNYQCQARLDDCRKKAVQVHHLTYRHWRNEPLFDLVSVCSRCHDEITRMERGELASIVAEKQAEHERFLRWWNDDIRNRLQRTEPTPWNAA